MARGSERNDKGTAEKRTEVQEPGGQRRPGGGGVRTCGAAERGRGIRGNTAASREQDAVPDAEQ